MNFYVSTPTSTLEARRRMMSRMINDTIESQQVYTIPMNLKSNKDEYTITAMLPGLSSEQVNIQFNNETLTIEGEYAEPQEEGFEHHLSELPCGRFTRSVEFNNPVTPEKIEAEMKNGILTVHVPKAEEAKPKTIKVVSKE